MYQTDAGSKRIHTLADYGLDVHTALASVATSSWWKPAGSGLTSADVAGVWQPKGAVSLAASYLRLDGVDGNANIDPAGVGGVAPATWDAVNGWGWTGAQYLKTGILPASGWSAFVRFSGIVIAGARVLFGSYNPAQPSQYSLGQLVTGVLWINGQFGTLAIEAPTLAAGSLAFSGTTAYRNGNPATPANPMQAWSGGAMTQDVYIGARGRPAPTIVDLFLVGNIQAIVFYKTVLSAAQNLDVHTAAMLI